jgi:hypothetical protein
MQKSKSPHRFPPYTIKFGDGVDKRSNRKTPGTSGEGPRPPRRDEYPDREKKDEEVDNLDKQKSREDRKKQN